MSTQFRGILCLLLVYVLSTTRASTIQQDLGSKFVQWKFYSQNKSKTLRYFKIIPIEKLLSGLALSGDAQVPGGIFADLKKANILKEDFFFRENDVMYRWVSWDNWTYHATFKGLQTLQAKIIDTIFCVLRIL